jgi:hypothetical protein
MKYLNPLYLIGFLVGFVVGAFGEGMDKGFETIDKLID